MRYEASLDSSSGISVENEGEQTHIALWSGRGGQQQSQGTGFTTGVWTQPPALFDARGGPVLQIVTNRGDFHFQIAHGGIRSLRDAPPLKGALPLKTAKARDSRWQPLPPMTPMEPMRPMKPMAPMEMTMGDMHMSMGTKQKALAEERTVDGGKKRFCAQCGKSVAPADKFCATCGAPLK